MKTQLHTYSFDLSESGAGPDGEYTKLEIALRHTPGRGSKMHAIKLDGDHDLNAGEIELETEFLFSNQWNSDKGRVFDWYEEAVFINGKEQPWVKRGHYLDITPEMVAIRQNTLKCGYTGEQFNAFERHGAGLKFNTSQSALGNPYLKESDLHLLRLLPVCEEWTTKREPLTKGELDYLLPLYIKAQTVTDTKQRDKQRADVLKDYAAECATATAKRDGYLWLLDHGVQTENCIYYSHTGRFSFGWRNAYTGAAREALLAAIAKFPFPYDVQ